MERKEQNQTGVILSKSDHENEVTLFGIDIQGLFKKMRNNNINGDHHAFENVVIDNPLGREYPRRLNTIVLIL